MYRGRYAKAIEELRQSILLHQTYKFATSEFRDRLFLARALNAKGEFAAAAAEASAAQALAVRLTFGPEWLTTLGRFYAGPARHGTSSSCLPQWKKSRAIR